MRSLALFFLVLFAGSQRFMNGATVYNFDSDTLGKVTTFTDTVGGLSATFVSSSDPGGLVISTTFFKALTGNVLAEPGPGGTNNLTLAIMFSSPQTSISLNFATASIPAVPFNLSAFNNLLAVGSVSATGVIPPGFTFPEGLISFGGPTFTRVTLSSAAPDFTIDNVTVGAGVAVPEPGLLPLFGFVTFSALAIGRIRMLLAFRRSSQTLTNPAYGNTWR